MVKAVLDGLPFMGEPTSKTPVVYLTEQPSPSFKEALKAAGLLDRQDLSVLSWNRSVGFTWPEVAAAETGMRAGELCGLRIEDMDLKNCTVNVKQTVWRGKVQTPKTVNAIRQFAISPKLAIHLRSFLTTWRPNLLNLVFATRNGTPWDQNLIVKRKLHRLLSSLGIERCGLHAFRHTNGSLMDRLNAPMKVRQGRLGHAPGSDITLTVYTHTVGEDDRVLAEKLGEILCPNVPNLAKRKIFDLGEGERIQ